MTELVRRERREQQEARRWRRRVQASHSGVPRASPGTAAAATPHASSAPMTSTLQSTEILIPAIRPRGRPFMLVKVPMCASDQLLRYGGSTFSCRTGRADRQRGAPSARTRSRPRAGAPTGSHGRGVRRCSARGRSSSPPRGAPTRDDDERRRTGPRRLGWSTSQPGEPTDQHRREQREVVAEEMRRREERERDGGAE